jgi:hypothetical protein
MTETTYLLTVDDDLPTGRVSGMALGFPLPVALSQTPLGSLRAIDGEIIDVTTMVREWHIDGDGRPRVEPASDRQPLTCAGGAVLLRDHETGLWRGRTGADDLADAVSAALTTIDAGAEAARQAFLTAGEGQLWTYQTKAAEAEAVLVLAAQGGPPEEGAYPYLSAEVGVTAPTLVDVAEVVSAAARTWHAAAATIEATRMAAKGAVRAATSAEGIPAILATLSWPAPGA